MKDSDISFTTSNRCTTDSATEWEFAYRPRVEGGRRPTGADATYSAYPERGGIKPEWHRKPVPVHAYLEEGGALETEANAKLRAEGHSEVILEELLAGRLYTGWVAVARARIRLAPGLAALGVCARVPSSLALRLQRSHAPAAAFLPLSYAPGGPTL